MAEDIPYVIHTNRELGLMLTGTKPLATFSDAKGRFPEAVKRYIGMFDSHVETGRFIAKRYFERNSFDDIPVDVWHHIWFALPGEEWRFDAMFKLKSSAGIWTEADERTQGELLGYSDEQNDWWIAYCKRSKARVFE